MSVKEKEVAAATEAVVVYIRDRAAASMPESDLSREDAHVTLKSFLWQDFGY